MSFENATRCYTKRDIWYIIAISFIFIVPIINLLTINTVVSSNNYVNWVSYYNNDNSDYKSVVESDDSDYYLLNQNESFNDLSVEKDSRVIINDGKFANFNLPYNYDPQLGYTNNLNFTLFGQRSYVFNFGNETNDDMVLYDSYPLENNINDYRHLHTVSNILSTLTMIMPINIDDDGSNVTYSIFNNFKDRFHLIPSVWDDFWENFELYFYIADENYNGIGYSYTRNESTSITDLVTKELDMNGEIYSIQMYNINVSSELRYSNIGNFYFSYYNSTKITGQYDFITDILTRFIDDLGLNFGSVNVSDFEGILTDISSITDHRGFYDFSTFNCKEFGYYIKLSTGFNISKYIEQYRYDVNYFDLGYEFANGVMIYFSDLFLGDLKVLSDSIPTLILNNVFYISIPLIVIVVARLSSTDRKKFKMDEEKFCTI